MVKNLPAMQDTQVQSPGQEDPLENGMATHSSILAQQQHRSAWVPRAHSGSLALLVRTSQCSIWRMSPNIFCIPGFVPKQQDGKIGAVSKRVCSHGIYIFFSILTSF